MIPGLYQYSDNGILIGNPPNLSWVWGIYTVNNGLTIMFDPSCHMGYQSTHWHSENASLPKNWFLI